MIAHPTGVSVLFANSRPLAIRDALLVAVSVSAITVAAWPAGPAKQSFTVHTADGQAGAATEASTYALALDDPRLAQLRNKMELWGEVAPTAELAVAHWRFCLAQHYAAHTDYESCAPVSSDRVVQVAYADRKPLSPAVVRRPEHGGKAAETNPATQAYWQAAGQRAAGAIRAAERRMAEQRAMAGPPPVAFGDIRTGPKSPWSIFFAVTVGLLAACGFSHWQQRWPAIQLLAGTAEPAATGSANAEPASTEPVSNRAESGDLSGDHALRIEIPAQWIGVTQPPAVQLRRVCLVALVVAAFFTTAIRWA